MASSAHTGNCPRRLKRCRSASIRFSRLPVNSSSRQCDAAFTHSAHIVASLSARRVLELDGTPAVGLAPGRAYQRSRALLVGRLPHSVRCEVSNVQKTGLVEELFQL